MAENKILYIIGGCNGAGKTTASYTVLPDILQCQEFVNADEIAKGLSPFHPEKVAIEAGKLMLLRIEELVREECTFSIETTLATKSYKNLIEKAHEKGYQIKLIFFWLDSPLIAIRRVNKRVSEGGHGIPEDIIIRRYYAGIRNFFSIYMDKVDYWLIINNTLGDNQYVAEGGVDVKAEIFNADMYNKMKLYVRE